MKNILLIQTGGTIAMDITHGEPKLDPSKWSELMYKEIPELSEIAEINIEQLFFEDSSDVNPKHWSRLVTFISGCYEEYDGFVILHGTDTMAYTASALSFGLQNLNKPVILTGSQVPMSNIRSDARRNLVNAIEMATLSLNEVAICFNDFIYRGNRATKMSIGDFDAFASPNFPPLAEIGLHIEINNRLPASKKPFISLPSFSDEVYLLKIFPGLKPSMLEHIDFSEVRILVVEAFGSGNFPLSGERSLLPFFEKCIEVGTILVITSQAAYDSVELEKYESGRKALEIGAISAKDMTTEATLTKIMYLLGNYSSDSEIKELFQQDIAGELTE
ncbi:MAG: asparaginase [Candidatus Halalkalibacterium sp. M3_1C_030]